MAAHISDHAHLVSDNEAHAITLEGEEALQDLGWEATLHYLSSGEATIK